MIGDDVPRALLDFARAHNATQIVLGGSRRSPLRAALTGAGVGATVTRLSGPIDVHMVSHDYIGKGRGLPRLGGGLTPRRRLLGALVGALALVAITPALAGVRHHTTLASDALIYLLIVVVVALVGGIFPALAAAIISALVLNWYFAPPIHSFTIYNVDNVVALAVYVVVAGLVSVVVDIAARRSTEAARSSAEAETLFTLAGSLLRGEQALPALLDRVLETFGMNAVSLLRRTNDAPGSEGGAGQAMRTGTLRGTWTCLASVGDQPCMQPEEGDIEVPVDDDLALVLRGRQLARRGPPGARRVRRRGGRGVPAATAPRGSRRGDTGARGRPDAHRFAQRRQSRPAQPARGCQSHRHQPALA